MTLSEILIVLAIGLVLTVLIIWSARSKSKSNQKPKPKLPKEDPWDHLSSEKEDTIKKISEILTENNKPDPNRIVQPRGSTMRGSFGIEGNRTMSYAEFTDIVCKIKEGEEIEFAPYEGRLCGLYGNLFIGTPYEYSKEKEMMRRLNNEEELWAMCTANRSYFVMEKKHMSFIIDVTYEWGPTKDNQIAKEIKDRKTKHYHK